MRETTRINPNQTTNYTNYTKRQTTNMNAVSLNNLWTYIQSLMLSASNQEWLADHLYKCTKEKRAAKQTAKLRLTQEDLKLSPEMLEPLKHITPLPKDFDFDKARADYLMQKYG